MAINLEKNSKPVNWVAIGVVGIIVILIVVGAYFLFFAAPTPGIEVLVPTEQRVTSQLSGLQFDTQPVVDAFNSGQLKNYASPVSSGAVGRTNPFVRF